MLDLGCGQGTNTIFLGSKGLEVVGIDLSPDAIAEAERRLAAAGALVLPRMSCTVSLPGQLRARAVLHVTGYEVCIHFVYLARVFGHSETPCTVSAKISDVLSMEVACNLIICLIISYRLFMRIRGGEAGCCNATSAPAKGHVSFEACSVQVLTDILGQVIERLNA